MHDTYKDYGGKVDIKDSVQVGHRQHPPLLTPSRLCLHFSRLPSHPAVLKRCLSCVPPRPAQLEYMHEEATTLRAHLASVDAWLVEQASERVVEMHATSTKLGDDVMSMLAELSDAGQYNDPESDMAKMVAALGGVERRLASE
jgi:hypothetical protein